jgi:transposase InsO family protein
MPWKETCAMEQKMQMIKCWKSNQFTITDLSILHDVSRKTIYKWIKRYGMEGPTGLEDRSRAPLRHRNATTAEVVNRILAIKRRHRKWGPNKVVAWLKEQYQEERWPAVSTVSEILKREGLVSPRRKRHRTPPYTDPFTACDKPNAVWCADFKGQFKTEDGELCYPLTITDSYSRYLLLCKGLSRPNFKETKPCFELVFREYGLPEAIRTDNGAPFASVGIGALSKLSVWFTKLGIRPERIEPGHPEQNGRHERMHRVLKETTASPPRNTMRAQQKAFDEFTYEYNFERPHEALGQKTPVTVYQKSNSPYLHRISPITYPYGAVLRKVNRNGEIKWKERSIYISKSLIGEHIALKRKEEHLWEIWFMHYPLGIANVTTRKVLPICPD